MFLNKTPSLYFLSFFLICMFLIPFRVDKSENSYIWTKSFVSDVTEYEYTKDKILL